MSGVGGVALGPMPMGPRARASLDPPLITVLFFILLESFVMSKHCLALLAEKKNIGFQLKAE